MNGCVYRAVIFDLDGVLWDGEPVYHEAFNTVLAGWRLELTEEDYKHIIGHTVETCWDWLKTRFALPEPREALMETYDMAVMRLLQRPVAPLPGVVSLISELERRGVPFGLASASLRQWVEATLKGLGLYERFRVIVSASEVMNGKPAPDLYLEAALRLGIQPEDCLAIEDTETGIASAKAAGMLAVQVRSATTAFPPLPQADIVLDSLLHFDFNLLEGARIS